MGKAEGCGAGSGDATGRGDATGSGDATGRTGTGATCPPGVLEARCVTVERADAGATGAGATSVPTARGLLEVHDSAPSSVSTAGTASETLSWRLPPGPSTSDVSW